MFWIGTKLVTLNGHDDCRPALSLRYLSFLFLMPLISTSVQHLQRTVIVSDG